MLRILYVYMYFAKNVDGTLQGLKPQLPPAPSSSPRCPACGAACPPRMPPGAGQT